MTRRTALALLLGACATTGCDARPGNATEAAGRVRARADRLASRLATADGTGPLARWVLPRSLGEVSGLALDARGQLLAHDDELGRVSVIEPRTGVLVRQFMLGDRPTMDDFEGITVADGMIYMVTSKGLLYAFRDGADGSRVRFTVHDTHLGKECEFEGVVYDAPRASLVLPCKQVQQRRYRDQLVLYRWRLAGDGAGRLTMTTIPMRDVATGQRWKAFHPSDITIDPASGRYVLVSALEQALVELTTDDQVALVRRLPGDHPRAEGIAITRDGILIVSDEAMRASASLTLYRWPLAAAEAASP